MKDLIKDYIFRKTKNNIIKKLAYSVQTQTKQGV